MSQAVITGRMRAVAEEEVTVFLVGMRIHRFRQVRGWWPVFSAMPKMLRELARDENSGLLASRTLFGGPRVIYVVQYWSSREALLSYAADPARLHQPAWAALNRKLRTGSRALGFWHETYVVRAGEAESVYLNMPAFGLGEAMGVEPAGRRAPGPARSRP